MNYLPHITVETAPNPTASVIWLHGLGASGHDFEPLVPHLGLTDLAVRFIFPHAPQIPVTINGGYVIPAWYDILAMDFERKIDEAQIQSSSDAIAALIEREIARGIASDKILLAGFSQGGAVAYHCGLSFAKPLAGILALSTYFATWKSLTPSAANAQIPVFLFHGDRDDVVPEAMGIEARRRLQDMGLAPHYQTYPMAHEVCMDEVQDIAGAIKSLLK
ncbi:alpha/beta hydrolase [Simiduia aestuariiviva]|uniref:Phospholipase/carboxylesterase n=1 Tax=Simiduia aestuariiviva TaxID=1510459 RepID=A0A839UWJ7_9GAMM|nr:carboxylesterase [Simiduia aestuariiviva]MBB3169737.1 phospholipase/carboxylesterase [Simiduia aestuariiviva]